MSDNRYEKLTKEFFFKLNLNNVQVKISKISKNFLITNYEITLDIYDFNLSYRINKRYTEFAGLYDSLKERYKNLNFPEFPSKTQIINKVETRKAFFDSLLKLLFELANKNEENKKDFMKVLFKFLSQNSSDETGKITNCEHDQYYQDEKKSFFESISSKNTDINILYGLKLKSSNEVKEVNQISDESKGWFIKYCFYFKGLKSNFTELDMKGYCKITNKNFMIYESIISNNFSFIMPLWKANFEFLTTNNQRIKVESQKEIEEMIENLNLIRDKKVSLNEIFSLKKLYVRINHPCDTSDLIICPIYDKNTVETLIKFYESIIMAMSLSLEQEAVSEWKYIKTIDETNYYIYGKLYFQIYDIITQFPEDVNIFIKISLDPYVYRSKTITSKDWFIFKQIFVIPIHNRFESILIELYQENNIGLFQKQNNEEKICEFKIKIPDLINDELSNHSNSVIKVVDKETKIVYSLLNLDRGKIQADIPISLLKLNEKYKKFLINSTLKNQSQSYTVINHSTENLDKKPVNINTSSSKDYSDNFSLNESLLSTVNLNLNQTIQSSGFVFNFKIVNISSIDSSYELNRNKWVLEEEYLKNDENFSMSIFLKRIKKVFAHIIDIKNSYKRIFHWAYPYFSLYIMITSIIWIYMIDLNYIQAHVLLFFLIILITNSNFYSNNIYPYYENYFNIKNSLLFDESDVLNIEDLEDEECLSNTYLIDKQKEESILKKLISPLKYYREYKEKFNKILYKLTKIISVIEKIKNLLLWKDPTITLMVLCAISLIYLISVNLNLRHLLYFSIIKKFIFGRNFYLKKNENNDEVSRLIISAIVKDWLLSDIKYYKLFKKNSKISENLDDVLNFLQEETSLKLNLTLRKFRLSTKFNIKSTTNLVKLQQEDNKSHSISKLDVFDHILKYKFSEMDDENGAKIKQFIKDNYLLHIDAVINNDFLASAESFSQIFNMSYKSKSILKIQKCSYLYNMTIGNRRIYRPPKDIEDDFYCLLLNVKSDLYYAKYYAKYEDD